MSNSQQGSGPRGGPESEDRREGSPPTAPTGTSTDSQFLDIFDSDLTQSQGTLVSTDELIELELTPSVKEEPMPSADDQDRDLQRRTAGRLGTGHLTHDPSGIRDDKSETRSDTSKPPTLVAVPTNLADTNLLSETPLFQEPSNIFQGPLTTPEGTSGGLWDVYASEQPDFMGFPDPAESIQDRVTRPMLARALTASRHIMVSMNRDYSEVSETVLELKRNLAQLAKEQAELTKRVDDERKAKDVLTQTIQEYKRRSQRLNNSVLARGNSITHMKEEIADLNTRPQAQKDAMTADASKAQQRLSDRVLFLEGINRRLVQENQDVYKQAQGNVPAPGMPGPTTNPVIATPVALEHTSTGTEEASSVAPPTSSTLSAQPFRDARMQRDGLSTSRHIPATRAEEQPSSAVGLTAAGSPAASPQQQPRVTTGDPNIDMVTALVQTLVQAQGDQTQRLMQAATQGQANRPQGNVTLRGLDVRDLKSTPIVAATGATAVARLMALDQWSQLVESDISSMFPSQRAGIEFWRPTCADAMRLHGEVLALIPQERAVYVPEPGIAINNQDSYEARVFPMLFRAIHADDRDRITWMRMDHPHLACSSVALCLTLARAYDGSPSQRHELSQAVLSPAPSTSAKGVYKSLVLWRAIYRIAVRYNAVTVDYGNLARVITQLVASADAASRAFSHDHLNYPRASHPRSRARWP